MRYIYLFVLLAAGFVQAQFQSNVSLSTFLDDNIYRLPDPQSELLTELGLSMTYLPEDDRFSYHGGLSYLSFLDEPDRNFMTLDGALRLQLPLDTKSDMLYTGLEVSSRFNSPEYNYYDFSQLNFYLNMNKMWSTYLLKAGLNYRLRSYDQFPDLNNHTYTLFTQLSHSFPTRTSVIIESDLAYKQFAGITIFDSTQTHTGGRGMGRNASSSGSYTTSDEYIPSMTQLVFLGRVAQSLTDKIGLYAQYRWQRIIDTQSEYQNQADFYQDEEIFDDPFSYHSQTYSTRLTLILPWQMKLLINGSYSLKDYHHEYAWLNAIDTVVTEDLRQDNVTVFNPVLTRSFSFDNKMIDSFDWDVEFYFRKNDSNSYWYNYKNSVVLTTFSIKF